jgi:hypothetical protein
MQAADQGLRLNALATRCRRVLPDPLLLQTVKKNGIGWLEALTDAMRGIPWMPTTTAA